MLPIIIAMAASAASSSAAAAAKAVAGAGATGGMAGMTGVSSVGAKMKNAAQDTIKSAIRSTSNAIIGEDTTSKLSDIVDSVEPGQGGGGGGGQSQASQVKPPPAPQASPIYSESAPKQRLADVSQQVHKVEAPPRYYGGFGAAAPIQQQQEQPEPFNMGQYFAGQLSAFRGK